MFAQTIASSPYSVYGVGSLNKRTASLNRALASTGIGLRDTLDLNNMNPAAYTSIKGITQLFEIGAYYETTKVSASDLSQTYHSGNLNALNLWFRYAPRWAGTAGISPYSHVNYNITANEKLMSGDVSEVSYMGHGGLSQVYWGNAFDLTKNLSIGINAAYVFGSLTKTETITLRSSKTTLEHKIFAHRINLDYGAQYSFVIQKNKKLVLGLVYEDDLQLKTNEQKLLYSQTSADTIKLNEESVNNYILPKKWGGGLSYQTPLSTFVMDVSFEEWSKAKLESGTELQDVVRFSAGYERKGNYKNTHYLNMLRLRSGVYIQQNYLVLNSRPFTEWGFSVGLGLPVSYGKSTIGLSYNYNSSGTTENNLIKQQGSVIVLDITIRDLWGIKRQFD